MNPASNSDAFSQDKLDNESDEFVLVDHPATSTGSQTQEEGGMGIKYLLVDPDCIITPELQKLALNLKAQVLVSGGKGDADGDNEWKNLARGSGPSPSLNSNATGVETTPGPPGTRSTALRDHSSMSGPVSIVSDAPYPAKYPGFYWKTVMEVVDRIKDDKASAEERLKAAEYLLVHDAALGDVLCRETPNVLWDKMFMFRASIMNALADARKSLGGDLEAVKDRVANRSSDEVWQNRQDMLSYMHAGVLLETQKPRVKSMGYRLLLETDKTLPRA